MALLRSSLSLLAAFSLAHARGIPRQISPSELQPSYDYIIVGGGATGLTVADRLTENPEISVLVLEAGGWGNLSRIAKVYMGNFTGFAYESDDLWGGITSVPQPGLGNKTFSPTLGKVVGGGSAVNAMQNLRGAAEDYDRWQDLFGGVGEGDWSWEGMLPYFKKALSFTPPPQNLIDEFNVTYDASYWGNTSDVRVSFPSFYYPGVKPLLAALREIPGVEFPVDSGAGKAGVFWHATLADPVTVTRSYARTGHYSNVNTTRSNYHLLLESPARRILVDSASKEATGVEFTAAGAGLLNVTASKEVLLAAGAVHSPVLLQLSGIGPQALLASAGIETIVDLPGVGQNFHDHSSLATSMNITLEGLAAIHPNFNDLTPGNEFQTWADDVWAANRSGPYSIAYSNICAWLPLTAVTSAYHTLASKLETQDFAAILPTGTHATVVAGYAAQMRALAAQMRSNTTAFMRMALLPLSGGQGPVGLQSFARGSVNLNMTAPWTAAPVVDYRALTNPIETDVFVEMIRFVRQFHYGTSLNATYNAVEYSPGADVVSDEALQAYVASNLEPTDYHPVGTCAMMPLDLGGVVDQNLRVYGVGRLRVVDTSVIPMLPSANTCQPAYAIGEKAADLIKSAA